MISVFHQKLGVRSDGSLPLSGCISSGSVGMSIAGLLSYHRLVSRSQTAFPSFTFGREGKGSGEPPI